MAGASIDRISELERLKEGLVVFIDAARVALGAAEMEFGRLAQWVEHEAPVAWKAQHKKATEDITIWKSAIFRKNLQKTETYRPDTSEEEEQLKRSQRQVAEAEFKLEECKKWRRKLEQARNEYTGPSGNLQDLVSGEPPPCVQELKRILAAIDAYRKIAGPGGIDPIFATMGGPGSGGPAATTAGGMANPTSAADADVPAPAPAPPDADDAEPTPEAPHGP